jgi:ABC-type amino acid transport system permease subunit
MMPTLASEMSTLIKESSLASVIGVMELSKEASLIRSRTYDAFSLLLASGLIYFTLTTIVTIFIQIIEKRWKGHVRSSKFV